MSLLDDGRVFAFSGNSAAEAHSANVRILRDGTEQAHFQMETPVEHLKISSSGDALLLYGSATRRVWRWQDTNGLQLLATATHSRDTFGCGFVDFHGEVLTLLAQHGVLRGISTAGNEVFTCNIQKPNYFLPRDFVLLPAGRVALLGGMFGDPQDSIVTVMLDHLVADHDAVHRAVAEALPISDRAVNIVVGPCAPDQAVVFRNPEDEEEAGEEQEIEDLGDVFGFHGIYVRDLDTRALVERYPCSIRVASSIAGTADWIAVQVPGGIDLVRRGSGDVKKIRGPLVLDPAQRRFARFDDDGSVEITPMDALAP